MRPGCRERGITMTSTADIENTTLRDQLNEVETWIDDGEYAKAALTCADVYMGLLARHPELLPPAALRPGQAGLQSGENPAASWAMDAAASAWPEVPVCSTKRSCAIAAAVSAAKTLSANCRAGG